MKVHISSVSAVHVFHAAKVHQERVRWPFPASPNIQTGLRGDARRFFVEKRKRNCKGIMNILIYIILYNNIRTIQDMESMES